MQTVPCFCFLPLGFADTLQFSDPCLLDFFRAPYSGAKTVWLAGSVSMLLSSVAAAVPLAPDPEFEPGEPETELEPDLEPEPEPED